MKIHIGWVLGLLCVWYLREVSRTTPASHSCAETAPCGPPDCVADFRARWTPILGAEKIEPSKHVMLALDVVQVACRYVQPQPNVTVLEWGSGGSTLFFSQFTHEYYSIEHDKKWSRAVQEAIDQLEPTRRSHVHLQYVPPSAPWSGDGSYLEFSAYVDAALSLHTKFDLVIIDGRARVACAKLIATRGLLNDGAVVLLHDYQRQEYTPVLEWFDEIERTYTEETAIGILRLKRQNV